MKIKTNDKFFFIVALLLPFLLSNNVHASDYDWEPERSYSRYSPVQIDILEDNGVLMNQYPTGSRRSNIHRAYLEAEKGRRYSIRIRNTSDRRIGLVIAVDGRNILSGKKSWLGRHEKMYILDPYETSTYTGWRTGKNRVNRFYFTDAGDSYADAWGDRSAMGVIAIAVYEEKHRHHYNKKHKHSSPQSKRRLGKSRSGYLADESAGTGFGEEEYSPSIRVAFKAKNKPVAKYFFKYEWRKNLCRRGVISCRGYDIYEENNRFWDDDDDDDYAPYPPGYYRPNGFHRGFNRPYYKK